MISQGPSVCIFNKPDSQEVLASWLFVQYLLSNDVQIAYSETEGYVPVTSKAQSAPEYQDYIARGGEDDNEHYKVKIEAAQMLLNHAADTFITPVFNGSTSLRDAAGQMIENVTKSIRRKEEINDAYMDKLFDDVKALYRLDQGAANASGQQELGPLPGASVALLCALAAAWLLMGAWAIARAVKHKRTNE